MSQLTNLGSIELAIISLRSHRVMLDATLAQLYEVKVSVLNQAVKRHIARFPSDFAFRLTEMEVRNLKSQSVISSSRTHGGARRALPMAFTEQGVAMLSGILNSTRAVSVNIEIMRAFVRMRQLLTANQDLSRKLSELENKYDEQFQVVFTAIRQLMSEDDSEYDEKKPLGFELQ